MNPAGSRSYTTERTPVARQGVVMPEQTGGVAPNGASSRLPLEGIRILDFTVVWAGPYATMQLAAWGAEIIRIESIHHFPRATRGMMARPPQALMEVTTLGGMGYPDSVPGEHPWNRVPFFNHHSRGKRSMTIDLRQPEGQAVLDDLLRISDGVIENNLPPNIEKQGLTWERVRQANPSAVMLRVPAFGLTGIYRNYRTFGNHMEALAGHPVIRAYPHLSLDYAPSGVPADAHSGVGTALAFLMGLRQRRKTGEGLMIELATAENWVPTIGEFIMDYTMNGRVWTQMGNEHWWVAPHNVYQCQGYDRWVAIAAWDDDQWRALCAVIGQPELAGDPRFLTLAARYEHRLELDEVLRAWTAEKDGHWIARRLQQAGVPAGLVMNEADAYEDVHLYARDFWQEIDHPEAGRHRQVGQLWKASKTALGPQRPAPLLGQDNEYVYRELLGFSEERYREFEARGHIGTEFTPDIP